MKIGFEGQVQSYFAAYKLTLVPGMNNVADDSGLGLLTAHASDCCRSKEKPRLSTDSDGLKLLASHLGAPTDPAARKDRDAMLAVYSVPPPAMAATTSKPPVGTSATSKDKKGAK